MAKAERKVKKELDLETFMRRTKFLQTALAVLFSKHQCQIIKELAKPRLRESESSDSSGANFEELDDKFVMRTEGYNIDSIDQVEFRLKKLRRKFALRGQWSYPMTAVQRDVHVEQNVDVDVEHSIMSVHTYASQSQLAQEKKN